MPLTDAKRSALIRIANERGLDANELVREAEVITAAREKPASGVDPGRPPNPNETPVATTEEAKLFQYHLPFVTVNEVRERWLKLDAWTADEGGEMVAAEFAAQFAPGAGPPTSGAVVTDSHGTVRPRKR